MTGPFTSIAQIQQVNEAQGQFWFSPDTMRFFKSRIESEVIDGRYFVSSEQEGPDAPRLFTVRSAEDDGEIMTVGDLGAYTTREEALTAAYRAADNEGWAEFDQEENR